jgi:sigma-E factor negative regulatory protein RseA
MREGDAMDKMNTREMMSALADGQLRGEELARAVEVACADAAARDAWHAYHLIGDVLRSGDRAAAGVASAGFAQRLAKRMAAEPMLATDLIATRAQLVRAEGMFDRQRSAANDASFRWKMVAGVASLAAVAAIGWNAVGGLGGVSGQPQLASSQQQAPTVLAGGERGVMIRDARLDELMAAHRQFGGASALPMPAGFLRNATFEGPAR